MSYTPNRVRFADTANFDAFSRLRVSDPVGLFSAQCQYDAEPLLFECGSTGSGATPTHSANDRMLTVSATNTGTSFVQSYEYIPYQAGKSQLIFITGVLGAAVVNTVTEVGSFDSANGLFIRQASDGTISAVRRTSTSGGVVDNVIPQSTWNVDKLDGTGTSGITLDVTKAFILVIDAQFLAMGRVRIGFDIGGQIVYCHESLHANVLAVPYMQTLTLPVQMLLTSTGGSKNTARFKCASVSSEGGFAEDMGYPFATPELTVTAASGARTVLAGLRPATTFNSLTNRQRISITSIEVVNNGATNQVFYEVVVGASYSGTPTWTAVNSTYSGAEYISAMATSSAIAAPSGGSPIVIASGYLTTSATVKVPVSAKISGRYPLTLNRAGTQRALGTLTVLVSGIGGTSACRASINYMEVR